MCVCVCVCSASSDRVYVRVSYVKKPLGKGRFSSIYIIFFLFYR